MVLDPVSALGIAANVLQFVDIASKVVSRSTQYYKSFDGSLLEYAELAAIAQSLSTLNRDLEASMRYQTIGKPGEPPHQDTPAEQGLRKANNECRKISVDLVKDLEALKVTGKHQKWQSLWHALRTTWSEERIETMSGRLTQAREQLMTHLPIYISSRQETGYQNIIRANNVTQSTILNAIRQSSDSLKTEVNNLSQSLNHAKAKDRRHILEDWQAVNRSDLNQLFGTFHDDTERTRWNDTKEKFLASLFFTRLDERRNRISEAHRCTFRWVYGGIREDGTRWDNFALWLEGRQTQDSVFWVSGKAGSGKSTLMRYLDDNEKTRDCLQKWSDGKILIVASCFFWKAGTKIQKSLTGMLRSLLHQILMQNKALIPDTSPLRWRSLLWGSIGVEDWTDVELINAMQNLVLVAEPTSRIAVFVDGLDEFGGNDVQLQSLIDLFHGLSQHPGVKICVSSRPWNIFEDAFAQCPKLRLELLTQDDIKLYVQDKLDSSPRFRQLSHVNQLGCLDLVKDVVEKASGVFLWVFLVVAGLTKCLRNGHELRTLRKRVNELPADLNAFFLQMINAVAVSDRPAASKAFQLVLAREKTSLMTLAFIGEETLEIALDATPSQTTLENITDRNESMVRRINNLCMGLLEAKRPKKVVRSLDLPTAQCDDISQTWNWEVDYLHRTVKDFLLSEECRQILRSYTDGKFDTLRYMCNSFLCQMMLLSQLQSTHSNTMGYLGSDATFCFFPAVFEDLMNTMVAIEEGRGSLPVALLSKIQMVLLDQLQITQAKPRICATPIKPGDTSVCEADVGKAIPLFEAGIANLNGTSSICNCRSSLQNDQGRNRVGECIDHWEQWSCSLLTLSLQYNLEGIYSVHSKPEIMALRKGRPYLDFALRRWATNPASCLAPKPHLIERLLLDGARPTDVFENDSVWGHFIAQMLSQCNTSGTSSSPSTNYMRPYSNGNEPRLVTRDGYPYPYPYLDTGFFTTHSYPNNNEPGIGEPERAAWLQTTELLIRHGALNSKLSSSDTVFVHTALKQVFGHKEAERLMSLPWKKSGTRQKPNQPSEKKQSRASLRDKLLPLRSKNKRL